MTERPRDRLGRPTTGPDVAPPVLAPDGGPETLEAAARALVDGLPFNAHEIFEARWKSCPAGERDVWRALAQWGAAVTHVARGNDPGAIALSRRAYATFFPRLVDEVPVLVDGELTLGPPMESDRSDLVAVFDDPDVALWNPGISAGGGTAAAERTIRDRAAPQEDGVTWIIRRDGRLVGRVTVHSVDIEDGNGTVGYWTAPWARREGVATSGVRTVSRWAFEELGLRRLQLYHAVENLGSCRVALSAGYAVEGTLRSGARYGDGVARDEHLHARLVTD